MNKGVVKLVGWLFAFMALIHLYRIYFPFPVVINNFVVQEWASSIVFVVAGLLSAWLFRSLCCDKTCREK